MGGVSVAGAGGKRSLDVELNLVPFIDMMSCLLAFLMLTAVFSHLAKIDIDQVLPKAQQPNQPNQDPPKIKKIQLLVDPNAYVLNFKDGDDDLPAVVLRRENGKMPTDALEKKLKELQELEDKDKEGNPGSLVLLVGRDKTEYADFVTAMDKCIGLKLTGISLGTDETVPTLVLALDGKS